MVKKGLLFILFLPASVFSQSISISPTSVMAVSQTPYASESMASYKFMDAHFIYVSKKVYKGQVFDRPDVYFGISVSPEIDLRHIQAEPIIGYYNKPVASIYGSRWNFGFSAYRAITNQVDIYIRHLSNAGVGELNPGIDWIGLRVNL